MKLSTKKILSKKFYIILFSLFSLGLQFENAVAQSFKNGDVFVGVADGRIQWHSANGTLIKTLNTNQGGYTTGMAFDKASNLYVTNFSASSVSKFNKSGVLQGTFGSGYSTPESIVFDSSGNAYVGDLGNGIRKYNSSGTFISTSYTGKTDWIDLAGDQCNMLLTSEGTFIARHNVCTNTSLTNFATGLGGRAFAFRIRKNGEVLLANGNNILRLSKSGSVLQTYDVAGQDNWFALNLNPDGTTFWSADFGTANVHKIDIATGKVLTTFNTGTGSSTVFGLSVFGEFTVVRCANNVPPSFVSPSPACGATLQATVGVQRSFTVAASDANSGDVDTLKAKDLPKGATMKPRVPTIGNPVSSVFSWTPSATDIGIHVVTFSAIDGCGEQKSCSYTINVTSGGNIVYYSKATGDLQNVLTWGVNPDGSGENPPDFGAGKTFNLANRTVNYTMTANWTVGGLIVNPTGSQLQISGYTLSEAGISGAGKIAGSATSNLIITGTAGGSAGTLNFTSGGGSLKNLTLNRAGTSASATIGSALNLYGVLSVTNGNLNTGNNITLKSSAANTARVAQVKGSISGSVTVERYIPARRAWRIISAPVGGSQTINSAWQEGATTASSNPNPHPGFGTHITGGPRYGSVANSFDQNMGSYSSIKYYKSSSENWDSVPNTNATAVNAHAYMLFIRGNRGLILDGPNTPPSPTVLRTKGPLKVGNQTFPVGANGFTAIPNPFASPINFATITKNNVQNNFYLWDPKMGGIYGRGAYVLVSYNGSGYDVTPASVSPESQYIQSGQGFLVHAMGGTAGSIVIKESDKSATAAANVFRPVNTTQGLRVNLQAINADNTTSLLDEVFSSYSSKFSEKIDDMDAPKVQNIDENLAIVRGGQTLMVERKGLPVISDTVHLKIWNIKQKDYLLEFNPINLSSSVLSAELVDNHLHTVTSISLEKVSQVFIRDAETAGTGSNRFMIVLASKSRMPSNLVNGKSTISSYPNPVSDKAINIQINNQPTGIYNIELINSLGQVVYKGQIKHAGGSATQMLQLANKPAKGVYQIRVTKGIFRSALPVIIN